MEFLKKLFTDSGSVTGLCDLKRKTGKDANVSSSINQAPEVSTPIGLSKLAYSFEPYFDNEQFETAIVNTFDVLYEELVDIYGVPNVQSNTTDAGIDIAMVLFWIVLILFIII